MSLPDLKLPPGARLKIAETPLRQMTEAELSGLRAGVSPMALIRSLDDKGQFVPGVGAVRGDGRATVGPARADYFDGEQLVEEIARRVVELLRE